jgi:hypothetical protein
MFEGRRHFPLRDVTLLSGSADLRKRMSNFSHDFERYIYRRWFFATSALNVPPDFGDLVFRLKHRA